MDLTRRKASTAVGGAELRSAWFPLLLRPRSATASDVDGGRLHRAEGLRTESQRPLPS